MSTVGLEPDLRRLRQRYEETGITHLLVSRLGPIESAPVYDNRSFQVYTTVP